jgi:hypothetical protein
MFWVLTLCRPVGIYSVLDKYAVTIFRASAHQKGNNVEQCRYELIKRMNGKMENDLY